jgi:hypothetical protein
MGGITALAAGLRRDTVMNGHGNERIRGRAVAAVAERPIGLKALLLMVPMALLIAFVATGCDEDDKMVVETGKAYVRVGHLSPDAGLVDVSVDGAVVLEDVEFRQFSGYLELAAGDHRVRVTPANKTTPVVIDATVTLDEATYYTVAAAGLLASIEPVVLVDDITRSSSMAKVRFVHGGPDAPNVDITLTDGTVLFADVGFKEFGDFIEVAPGAYDLQVRVANTTTVALSFGGVPLSANTVYTVFAVGRLGDGTLAATVTVDAPGTGSATVDLEGASASLRVGHFSPDAPAVDVYLNDTIVLSLTNVPFSVLSGYLSVPATTHNVKVYVTGTTTGPVINETVTLLPSTSYTAAATGLVGAGDLTALVLVDDSAGPEAGQALVRFVHLSPDAPEVDVVVASGPTLFGGYQFREFSDYSGVAAGTYDLEVRLTSGGALALSVPGVQLMDGTSYTVFAIGLAGDGSLTALPAVDFQ